MAGSVLDRIRSLYLGGSPIAQRFRYGLLIFDIFTIVFVIVTSFTGYTTTVIVTDLTIAAVVLADFFARLAIEPNRGRFFLRLTTWADVVAILSFLAPLADEAFGFLRILRTMRLLRTYQMLSRLRQDFEYFRKNEDVVLAGINLTVFLFVMTGLIYALQHKSNPEITNYADALYFTVTTLTTTGFGDVTLTGTSGRMLAVAVMIFGVTLFLRLAQVLFRPSKVRVTCESCGLTQHDADAVHCKHCGATIRIITEGSV